MGTWNIAKPYGNDIAADWLGALMDTAGLRLKWLAGIEKDPAKEPEIVRAAVWLFVQLGHVYVWPIVKYEADLELAIKAAAEMMRLAMLDDRLTLVGHLAKQREALKARCKPTELAEPA